MVTVKDPEDSTKFIKVPKLLLQVSIRELHTDVIENVEGATNAAEDPGIIDTKLCEIFPPEMKRMTDRYKEMCACQLCVLIGYYHSALKRYRLFLKNQLKENRDRLRRRRGYQTAAEKLRRYTREFIDDDKAKDSLKHIYSPLHRWKQQGHDLSYSLCGRE